MLKKNSRPTGGARGVDYLSVGGELEMQKFEILSSTSTEERGAAE